MNMLNIVQKIIKIGVLHMNFKELLNNIYNKLECTQIDLSTASGLSASVISRYLSGEREPAVNSEQLISLAKGIEVIAMKNGMTSEEFKFKTVLRTLKQAISYKENTFEQFVKNLNELINCFRINMKSLAGGMNFDVSYLYRVRSGERRPTDINKFCILVAEYTVSKYHSANDLAKAAILLKCDADILRDNNIYSKRITNFLMEPPQTDIVPNHMQNFLKTLDEFNLDEYIRTIHFDELKVPSVPFLLPVSKNYYGIEQIKKGELVFFKETVLSKSMEPIFMCSDMPMSDMAEDTDFGKKWMFAIAMSLKKGLHLNIIHNIDRPFEEMMLGLEAWIPIYMTGQISPFHLPDISTNIYHHLNYVSGSVALTGECINGHHENSKYYLTNNKEEVAYYKRKSLDILEKAKPLMEIFTEETNQKFNDFLNNTVMESGPRHNILSAPPLYTLTNELLEEILSHSDIDSDTRQQIADYIDINKENTYKVLEKNTVLDELIDLSEEEFNSYPVALPLAGLFIDKRITYTYKEYKKHIELCREFSRAYANYSLKLTTDLAFRNIQICIIEGKFVLISKSKTPVIHFVIRHPKMVTAIEKFVPLVIE